MKVEGEGGRQWRIEWMEEFEFVGVSCDIVEKLVIWALEQMNMLLVCM